MVIKSEVIMTESEKKILKMLKEDQEKLKAIKKKYGKEYEPLIKNDSIKKKK